MTEKDREKFAKIFSKAADWKIVALAVYEEEEKEEERLKKESLSTKPLLGSE